MQQFLTQTLTSFHEWVTLCIIFPAILILGAYFTFKLKAIQISKIPLSIACLIRGKREKNSEGDVSHYQAISAVLAGNLGTGNISGMAVALATGGPGALVWMWLMAFFGAAIQYASCVLGVFYREKTPEGGHVGGPMYYLSQGLGSKTLAALFAIFSIFAAFTVGNLAQVHSVTHPLSDLSLNPFLCSLVIAGLVGVVILGGVQRLARVASAVVPLMAMSYLSTALVILVLYYKQIIPALSIMLSAAFDLQSVAGGALGFGVVKAMTTGFGRGIFATDAGTGMAPLIQSSAKTSHAVLNGVVALLPPFLVMIVCTMTGLVLMVTGAWKVDGLQSTQMCTYAFKTGLGSSIGTYVVIVSLILFAYTTILAWAICIERSVEYLWDRSKVRWFLYLYIAMVPVGALMDVNIVWVLADVAIAFMMMTNLIGVTSLARIVVDESRRYFGDEELEETIASSSNS